VCREADVGRTHLASFAVAIRKKNHLSNDLARRNPHLADAICGRDKANGCAVFEQKSLLVTKLETICGQLFARASRRHHRVSDTTEGALGFERRSFIGAVIGSPG